MRDFDNDFKKHSAAVDRKIDEAARHAKIIAALVIPLYLIGGLLILGLLAVALYGLAHYVGLI